MVDSPCHSGTLCSEAKGEDVIFRQQTLENKKTCHAGIGQRHPTAESMALTALINVDNMVGESQSIVSLLITDLQAAVANWSAVLKGSAVLNIELSIVTSNPGGDRGDWGFSVPIGQA